VDLCSINGCARKLYSRKGSPLGYCQHHHHCWRRFGDAMAGEPAIFAVHVDKSRGANGCWPWTGGTLPQGYGVFHRDEVAVRAHRIAWEHRNGAIPTGVEIDHECLNMGCVNPAHLRLATPKQNREHRQGAQRNSETGLRGVGKRGNRYVARVRHHGKDINLGRFDTAEAAAEAARLKRVELFTHNAIDRRVGV
jgi:hypothetical protein